MKKNLINLLPRFLLFSVIEKQNVLFEEIRSLQHFCKFKKLKFGRTNQIEPFQNSLKKYFWTIH